jgi:hypothetical protein
MNIFLNIFFIFLFMYTLIIFRLPNIYDSRFVLHKFVIFTSVFCFQFILLLLSKIGNKCKIDIIEIFKNSFMTAIYGILGYSIYNDMIFTGLTRHPERFLFFSPRLGYLCAAISITAFISVAKLFTLSLDRNYQICEKQQ